MESRARSAGAGVILIVLAVAMLIAGITVSGPSANADIVRAIYYAAASILVGLAVLAWAM